MASSFLSVAIAEVFGSALAGKSKEREALVDTALPLAATFSVLPCRGGEPFLRRLFEPLGYTVTAQGYPLDDTFGDWGDSAYFTVHLENRLPLRQLLTHLYVLIPVLDNDKHYWVGDDEVDKLLRRGAGWLATHPEREIIATRYLKHRRSLVNDALERLVGEEGPSPDPVQEKQRQRIQLLHGSLMYRDKRLAGFEAAAVVEVIEHLDPPRLAAFERVLFECARPGTVVLTTPIPMQLLSVVSPRLPPAGIQSLRNGEWRGKPFLSRT